MPMATIQLPRDMILAAQGYAAHEHRTIAELFGDFLSKVYGYAKPTTGADVQSQRTFRDSIDIPGWIDEITGVVALPADKDCKDLIHEAVVEKYGAVS